MNSISGPPHDQDGRHNYELHRKGFTWTVASTFDRIHEAAHEVAVFDRL